MNFNKVILAGHLTRDPEKRYTDGGTCVVNLSLAVNYRVKKQDQWIDEVSFFDIVTFGNRAESCAKYLQKGSAVLVDGELRQRRWEAQDGSKRSKIEVQAGKVEFLSKRDESAPADEDADSALSPIDDDSEIPF